MSDATEAWEEFQRECREMEPEVYAHTIGHEARFKAGFAAGQVHALEDAADELSLAANPFKWDAADWLRARAAELRSEQDGQVHDRGGDEERNAAGVEDCQKVHGSTLDQIEELSQKSVRLKDLNGC